MAEQPVDSKVGDSVPGNGEAGLSGQDKKLPVTVTKTPLRDLQSENNIVPQKVSGNPLVLKEAVITEASKVSGTKRLPPESPMSPRQHSPSNNGGNGHLVYVRRKSEAEAGKNINNEVIADNVNSPQPRQVTHQDDVVQSEVLIKEPRMQGLPAYAPIPTASLTSIPSGKPSVAFSVGNSKVNAVHEEVPTHPFTSPAALSAQARVNKQNWEERYLELQMFLKKLDQSSLEDHLQMLRSLSAVELSRHAVELEKRAIQLSLEQGKEMQRVKALNILGKSTRTSNGPPAQQQMPQN